MVNKRRRSKKWIWWVIILALLIVASVVVYLVWDNYFNDKKQDTAETSQTEEQIEQKKEIENKQTINNNSDEEDDKKVKQYEGDDPNTHTDLSGVITYAGVVNNVLMIRVNIDQFLESGECGLTLNKNGATIYSSIANITGNVSTSTCEGFDVPVSQLDGGDIQIIINLNANNKSGMIRGEVNI